ncbi:hypothetical protein BaRGS_00023923, partial [Batillaria attramentaria]
HSDKPDPEPDQLCQMMSDFQPYSNPRMEQYKTCLKVENSIWFVDDGIFVIPNVTLKGKLSFTNFCIIKTVVIPCFDSSLQMSSAC